MPEAKLKVLLLNSTPDPEWAVAMASKLCYSPSDIEGLRDKIDARDQKAFVENLVSIGHMSPLRHFTFTFGVEGISRTCSHQVVRHHAGFDVNQQSQRYVRENDFDYIIPPEIAAVPHLKIYFEGRMRRAQEDYNKMIAAGISEEDARFLLPNAAETKIIITANGEALLNFFRQRCCNRAQWEIRALAIEMLRQVREIAPTIFKNAGPPCVKGPCAEKGMSCGKAGEVRAAFRGAK